MTWTPSALATVSVAAFLAGALNAVAGGGSFLTFPTLLLVGAAPLRANATSTLALWPGSFSAAVGYRSAVSEQRKALLPLCIVSLLGGAVGALLLVLTPEAVFSRGVPWLLLIASVLFSLGPRLTRRRDLAAQPSRRHFALGLLGQGLIAVYGGYFGGGMGFALLALYSVLALGDIHAMNGVKSITAVLLNGIAAVILVAKGFIDWIPEAAMVPAAILGGYLGAVVARRVPPARVRLFVGAVAWGMTGYFFFKTYR